MTKLSNCELIDLIKEYDICPRLFLFFVTLNQIVIQIVLSHIFPKYHRN